MNFATQSTFEKSNSLTWRLSGFTLIFAFLFHNSGPGLNMAIFSLALLAFWLFHYPQYFKKWEVALSATITFFTAVATAWYGSGEMVFWTVLCLLLLSRQIYFPQQSLLLLETKSVLNLFLAPVLGLKQWLQIDANDHSTARAKVNKILLLVVLPLSFTWLFASMYSQLNPYFEKAYHSFGAHLDFSLILTLILGLVVAFILLRPVTPQIISNLDQQLANDFSLPHSAISQRQETERQVGLVLFALLNFTLLALLVSDVFFLQEIARGRANDYSQYVHQGVGLLILSIVLAGGFILYFFRSAQAALLPNSHWLKALALIWVLLNIGVAITTAFKNGYYVAGYSLTLKRIGVFVYLSLAVAGLVITLLKLYRQKTNVYMLRQLYWSFFVILSLNMCIDWSSIITRYNLQRHVEQNQSLDLAYLLSLDDRVIPIIYKHKNEIESNALIAPAKSQATLSERAAELKLYQPAWREISLAKLRARQELRP